MYLFYLVSFLSSTQAAKLIFATALFRHGARAPAAEFNPAFAEVFANGIGEMTPNGLRTSMELGRFLGERYVDTHFLSTPLKNNEIFFRSLAINRCLLTASAVGYGMFNNGTAPANSLPVLVPVYSQHENETLLSYDKDKCIVEHNRLKKYCYNVPPMSSFPSWPAYEGFVFECLGFHLNSTHFPSGADFIKAESLVVEEQNDMEMPAEFFKIKGELYEYYNKVFRFIIGVGEYHDDRLIRMKSGFLLHTILDNMENKWRCRENHSTCKKLWRNRKFVAYSTQDWLLALLLESFGILNVTVGEGLPHFNSMILIELWDVEGRPEVKIFYKEGSKSPRLNNMCEMARGCSSGRCPMREWMTSLRHLRTNDPWKVCMEGEGDKKKM